MSKIDDEKRKLMIISPTGRCTFPSAFDLNPMRHDSYAKANEGRRRFLHSSFFGDAEDEEFPSLMRPREKQYTDKIYYFSAPMPSAIYEDYMLNLLKQIGAAFGMPYEYVAGQMRDAYDYERYALDANLRTAAQGQWSAPRYMAEVIGRPPKFEKRRTAGAWNILIIRDWIKANFKPALKEDLRWDHMPLHPDFYTDSTMRMRRMLQRVFDPFGFDLIGQSVVGLYSEWLRRDVSPTIRSLSAYHSNVRLGTPYLPPRKGKS